MMFFIGFIGISRKYRPHEGPHKKKSLWFCEGYHENCIVVGFYPQSTKPFHLNTVLDFRLPQVVSDCSEILRVSGCWYIRGKFLHSECLATYL